MTIRIFVTKEEDPGRGKEGILQVVRGDTSNSILHSWSLLSTFSSTGPDPKVTLNPLSPRITDGVPSRVEGRVRVFGRILWTVGNEFTVDGKVLY